MLLAAEKATSVAKHSRSGWKEFCNIMSLDEGSSLLSTCAAERDPGKVQNILGIENIKFLK